MIQEANREIGLMRSKARLPKVVSPSETFSVPELKVDMVLSEIKNPALHQLAKSLVKLDSDVNSGAIDGENARIRFGVQKELTRLIALDMAKRAMKGRDE